MNTEPTPDGTLLSPPPCSVIRNRHTGIVTPVLRQDANGDVVVWSQSGKVRLGIEGLQQHWQAVDGCPVCGGTGKVWNMPDDREETCKVCSPNAQGDTQPLTKG